MITVKCTECNKEFEAQRTSAKFCSANCRVKFNNKLGDLKVKITTANKISPKIEVVENTALDSIKECDEDLEQGKRLRQFAKLNKTDCDTIFSWLMDNYGKKIKTPLIAPEHSRENNFHDFTLDKSYKNPYNPFDNPIYRAKMAGNGKKDSK